ncbi:hypothetical protein Pint_30146 [Pistacia integerrima]|uniref:Uncharacterized protein n=1 Tax=Pistacia integerrima TaxID=434235 RepID=A0ACC0X1J5_9ROSI|nr:hypothetical protein Pint_30146 [Pistacia integerrima]
MVRALVERRCVDSVTINDGDDHDRDFYESDDDYDYEGSVGRKLTYIRLPQTQLSLSVLKLDGSFFDVHVARNVTVAELKEAVEEVFALSPRDSQGKISWMHVWGHFCLSYEGQKLVNDKARIQDFRIKDGDQLQFVRHMSINYLHSKRLSRTQSVVSTQHSMSSSGSGALEEMRHTYLADKENYLENQEVSSSSGSHGCGEKRHPGLAYEDSLRNQEDSYNYYNYEHVEEMPAPEFKLAHFLRGWLSYTRLWGVSRRTSEGKSRPSRFARHRLAHAHRNMVCPWATFYTSSSLK